MRMSKLWENFIFGWIKVLYIKMEIQGLSWQPFVVSWDVCRFYSIGTSLYDYVSVKLVFKIFLVAQIFWLAVSDREKVRLWKMTHLFPETLDLCGSCMKGALSLGHWLCMCGCVLLCHLDSQRGMTWSADWELIHTQMKRLKTTCQVFLTFFSLSLSYCLSLYMCLICLFPMIQTRSVVLKKRKLGDALFFIGPEEFVWLQFLYTCVCLMNTHKLNLEMPQQHAAQWLIAVRCTSDGFDLFLDAEICSHIPPGFIVMAVWGTILRITVSVFSELAVRDSRHLAQGCFDQLFKWLSVHFHFNTKWLCAYTPDIFRNTLSSCPSVFSLCRKWSDSVFNTET